MAPYEDKETLFYRNNASSHKSSNTIPKLDELSFYYHQRLFSVLRPQENCRWKEIAETMAYFEIKNQCYYKSDNEKLKDIYNHFILYGTHIEE